MKPDFSRRRMLTGLMAGAGVAMLAGCDRMTQSTQFGALLRNTEKLTMSSQRLLLERQSLAREYSVADLSPVFRANGTQAPDSEEYAHLLEHGFANWRLQVDGLVQQPLSLSLSDLKRLPSRTQITRHDCVEGWSAIGQWQGVHLGRILDLARLKPGARYVVFHCADELEITFDGSVNRTENRGGCLVKVKQGPQRMPRVVDSNVLRLQPAGYRRSTRASVDG